MQVQIVQRSVGAISWIYPGRGFERCSCRINISNPGLLKAAVLFRTYGHTSHIGPGMRFPVLVKRCVVWAKAFTSPSKLTRPQPSSNLDHIHHFMTFQVFFFWDVFFKWTIIITWTPLEIVEWTRRVSETRAQGSS